MREKIERFFMGRQGMDELSKTLFWSALSCIALAVLLSQVLNGAFGTLFLWLGLFQIIFSFFRAFSHRLEQREAENTLYLSWLQTRRRRFAEFRDRRSQRGEYKFFRCPGCGGMVRVPRGKGKLHIKCKCGYTLYRKT